MDEFFAVVDAIRHAIRHAAEARRAAAAAAKAVTAARLAAQRADKAAAKDVAYLNDRLADRLANEAAAKAEAKAAAQLAAAPDATDATKAAAKAVTIKYYHSTAMSVNAKVVISNREIKRAYSNAIAANAIAKAAHAAVSAAMAAKAAIAVARAKNAQLSPEMAVELTTTPFAKTPTTTPEASTTTPFAAVCADSKVSTASKAAALAAEEAKTAWDKYTLTVKTNLALIYAAKMKFGVKGVLLFGSRASFLQNKLQGEAFARGYEIARIGYNEDGRKHDFPAWKKAFMSRTALAIDEDTTEFLMGYTMAFTEPSDQKDSYLELGQDCSFMRGMIAGNTAKDQFDIGTADETQVDIGTADGPSAPKRPRT